MPRAVRYFVHQGRSGEWPPEQRESVCCTGEPSPDGFPHNLKGSAPWPREGEEAQDGSTHAKPSYCPAFSFSSPVSWCHIPCQPSSASFLSWCKSRASSILRASAQSSCPRGPGSWGVAVHLWGEQGGKQKQEESKFQWGNCVGWRRNLPGMI